MLFSMIYDNEAGRNVVSEALAYQVKGLETYIKSLPFTVNHELDNTINYIYDDNVDIDASNSITHNRTVFSINTFNYKKMGLQGIYDDFYELSYNNKTYILSYNKDVLCGFCGWINRLTTM